MDESHKVKKNGLTVGIPIWNQVRYANFCIRRVLENTPELNKLVIIDDNSTMDNYIELLENIKVKHMSNKQEILVIRNKENIGFPKNCNKIIDNTSTEFLAIVTSDVIVTKDWAKDMLSIMEKYKDLGIVSPMTCWTSGKQCIGVLRKRRYKMGIKEIEQANRTCKLQYDNQIEFVNNIMGFVMFLRMSILEKIKEKDYFDEQFSPGSCEDTDICIRMIKKGYKIGIAKGVYVHHYGKVSFSAKYNNVEGIWRKNMKKLLTKYPDVIWDDQISFKES